MGVASLTIILSKLLKITFSFYLANLSSTFEMDLVLKKYMLPLWVGNTSTVELENSLANWQFGLHIH